MATQAFEYHHAGKRFRGQLALPSGPAAGTGPHPAVMVMHDGRGIGDFVRARAEVLAGMGYVALATDMYGDGIRYTEPRKSTKAIQPLRADEAALRARVVGAYQALAAHPMVDAGRIGAIGYCFGGQCVLELARSGVDAKAVVSFHGTLRAQQQPEPNTVKARMLVLTGALDPFAPATDVAAFQQEMTNAGADWHVTVYAHAKHGFTDPISDETAAIMDGVGYDALVDRLSWAQATAFLEAALKE
jgi:dienelactone hydrolase